jgi:anti-anti-sigma factor
MFGTYEPSGEIDAATAPAFLTSMRSVIDGAEHAAVFVDCSAVTFMDSAAFHALVAATLYAAGRGHHIVVRGLRSHSARMLRMCDLHDELAIEARFGGPS